MKKLNFNVSEVLANRETKKYNAQVELDTLIIRATEIKSKSLSIEFDASYIDSSDKNESIYVDGHAEGILILNCHRCLENFEYPLKINFKQVFDESVESDYKIEQFSIDIMPLIRESLFLKLPIKLLCRDDCKGICSGCGKNLDKEHCLCEEKPADDRWNKLKDYFKDK